jgi:hypothetical protein
MSLQNIFSMQTQTSLDKRLVEPATQGGMQIASQVGGTSVKGSLFHDSKTRHVSTRHPRILSTVLFGVVVLVLVLLGAGGGRSYRGLIVVVEKDVLHRKLRVCADALICGGRRRHSAFVISEGFFHSRGGWWWCGGKGKRKRSCGGWIYKKI